MTEQNVVELRTGHVFVAGSVKAVTPLDERDGYDIVGVGFRVTILPWGNVKYRRKQQLDKLKEANLLPFTDEEVERLRTLWEQEEVDEEELTTDDRTFLLKFNSRVRKHAVGYCRICHQEAVELLLGKPTRSEGTPS